MLYRLRNGALAGRDAGVKVVVLATGTNDIGFDMGRALNEPRQHAQDVVQRCGSPLVDIPGRSPQVTQVLSTAGQGPFPFLTWAD